ncbi:MAG TPA: Xaa-Pro peptidase family protein [Rhodanobacteraceae bacterium]|nr:Xaa-Pro peptidase family protein [Rhodanobacteraceae bacterium]
MQTNEDTLRRSRRRFLQTSALGAAALPAVMLGGNVNAAESPEAGLKLPKSILALQPVASKVVPISDGERRARMARAQQLMGEHGMDAIFVDAGTTLDYFAGLRWWNSERTMGMLLPKSGDPVYIVPAFERSRTQERIRIGSDVRTWQENESPYMLIAGVMREHHAGTGVLGIDDRVPFYRATEIGEALPQAKLVEATRVTAGCRAIKSPAELALMQIACDATLSVYRAAWEGLEPGMTQHQVLAWIDAAYQRMGLRGEASINVGKYTAQPHGSNEPQHIVEGTPVMLDDGCYVEGYQSDITRTFTLGKASDKMKRVFDIVRKAQTAALAAARPDATMESVDTAARKVIVDAGYGPGYKYFSHRLGHGIGMDMHEWYYLVGGNTRKIKVGMTFSDEPGIYIPGEFGVRLEDDMHVTEAGARWFTPQSPSIEQPFG